MILLGLIVYLALGLKGEKTISERKEILDAKLKELQHKIQKIQESIDYINWKHQFYDDVLSGQIKYYSNLIQTKSVD